MCISQGPGGGSPAVVQKHNTPVFLGKKAHGVNRTQEQHLRIRIKENLKYF